MKSSSSETTIQNDDSPKMAGLLFEYVSRHRNTQQWRSASLALEVVWREPHFF